MTTRSEYRPMANSYACWLLAITAMREISVRRGHLMPINEAERIQREQGPVPMSELDCVRCKMSNIAAAAAVPEEELKRRRARIPCPYMDPHCPCQDGDACHYEDVGSTTGWPVGMVQQNLMAMEIKRLITELKRLLYVDT